MAATECQRSEDIGGVRGYTYHGHFIRGLTETAPKKLFYRSVFLDAVQLMYLIAQMEENDLSHMGVDEYSQAGTLSLV